MDRRLLFPGIAAFLIALLVIGAIIYFLRPSLLGRLPNFGVQTTAGMAQSANTATGAAANTAQVAPVAPGAAPAAQVAPTAIPQPPPATATPAPVIITAVPAIEVSTAVAPIQPVPPAPLPDPGNPTGEVNLPATNYSPAACNTRVTHTVRVGENLFRIALRYRTTAAAVARMNGITNVRRVSVGQRLRILVCGRGYSGNRAPRGAAYVVQPGDTIFRIALRYGVNVQYLCSINGLYSNLIVPGQTLVIP